MISDLPPLPAGFSGRPGRPDDAAAVTACVHAAYARWVPIIGTRPGPMLEDYARVLVERQVHVVHAAERGSGTPQPALAGILVLDTTDDGFLLDNVAVRPDLAGQGIGAFLLALAEREAARQGHVSIHLYTHERMVANQNLYRRIGYVEFDRRDEHGFRRVYMRKPL